MFYSKQTGGFYDFNIHGDNIPSDAVEIAVEEHAALLQGQSQGKHIVADVNGFPVLQDHVPPTTEQLAEAVRIKRDDLLSRSDWVTLRSIDTGEAVPQEWLGYRQALRDIPTQAGFPACVTWPEVPPQENET